MAQESPVSPHGRHFSSLSTYSSFGPPCPSHLIVFPSRPLVSSLDSILVFYTLWSLIADLIWNLARLALLLTVDTPLTHDLHEARGAPFSLLYPHRPTIASDVASLDDLRVRLSRDRPFLRHNGRAPLQSFRLPRVPVAE